MPWNDAAGTAAIVTVYFALLAALSWFGLHRALLIHWASRHAHALPPRRRFNTWPRVTVQIPIYNEYHVAARIIDAAAALDYPADALEIQILDDSTDATTAIVLAAAARARARGARVTVMHRAARTGYKAGALAAGLAAATGEFIAVFDADFLPGPDFLRRTLPYFATPRTGMVQTAWGHLNRGASWLTRAQALLLDAHFYVEHWARAASGRFFNFNGTAGIWRRETIIGAGGWQADTLTEDLDLSYRAQLRGWRFAFAPDVRVPAELPETLGALRGQQARWAAGGAQTGVKLLPALLRARLPWFIKLEALTHLASSSSYLLAAALAVIMPLAALVRFRQGWRELLLIDLPFFLVSSATVALYYLAGQYRAGNARWLRAAAAVPVAFALGAGLAVSNAAAVAQALLSRRHEFVRTPKSGAQGATAFAAPSGRYAPRPSRMAWLEGALALYFTTTVWVAFREAHLAALPFLFLFQTGFLYCALASAIEGWLGKPATPETAATPWPGRPTGARADEIPFAPRPDSC